MSVTFGRRALVSWVGFGIGGGLALLFALLVGLGWRDTRQTRHSVLRNSPVIGHLRFLLEFIRPEMRQYFKHLGDEFRRTQRVYRTCWPMARADSFSSVMSTRG